MNDVYLEAFNNQTFNQDGDEFAILGINFYSPPKLIFQHLPVKEKIKKVEVNFKVDDILVSDKLVKTFIKHE